MALSKGDKNKDKGKGSFDNGVQAPPLTNNDFKVAAVPPFSNNDTKVAAVSVSANKDSIAMKSPIVSPPRGRKSKQELLKSRAFPTGWYIRSCLVQGGLEAITITTNTMTDDAYIQPLVKEIDGGPQDGSIAKLGLLGAFSMRVSLTNPSALMNKKSNTYQRKAFIRVLDENELDDDTRLAGLKVIKNFMEESKSISYKTAVFIDPGWNLNLTMADMPKLDHFLQYGEIVRVINKLFDEVMWTEVDCFLTQGHIPAQAVDDLGCPPNKVINN